MILTPSFGSTLTLKIPCSTKPAPLFCGFFVRTRQHCLFPVLAVVFPHPLQNRVPRVQVLLPLPQNRRKHWVSAGFLFACVAWFCGSLWFGHWVFSSGLTRSQLFPSPPAPKTHPVSPCRAESGAFFSFLLFSGCKIFALVFVHLAA